LKGRQSVLHGLAVQIAGPGRYAVQLYTLVALRENRTHWQCLCVWKRPIDQDFGTSGSWPMQNRACKSSRGLTFSLNSVDKMRMQTLKLVLVMKCVRGGIRHAERGSKGANEYPSRL
jgi:hypothetical protein